MRAERRHHRERLKIKRSKYVVAYGDPTPTRVGKLARTATPCSCEMCCNARRAPTKPAERLTIAERRFFWGTLETDDDRS